MPAKAYENTLDFCLSRWCLRVLSTVYCCVLLFLMASPLLFVWTGSTEQFSGSPADFALSALLFFPALLAAFLLPTRMFAVQREALCVLSAMGAVRRRVAMGSIRALYIVGAAESFPYAGQKRFGRWEKGSKGQKRKFVYLPSVLVYDTAQEGVYRGKDRTHYDGFVYAFVVTGKNSEALWTLLHNTACPVWLDGDLLEGNACLRELYQDKDIAARLLPLVRDRFSSVRQRR